MTETPETAGREQGGKLGWHPPCYARALIRKFPNQGIWLKNRYPAQSSLLMSGKSSASQHLRSSENIGPNERNA
jgi:hypothetical protein